MLSCGLLATVLSDIVAWDVYTKNEIKQARRHYERAGKLYRKELYDQAIDELDRALSVREIYPEAQWLLARALVKAERPREAFETLRTIDSAQHKTADFCEAVRAGFSPNE